jgi:hypothetical protein
MSAPKLSQSISLRAIAGAFSALAIGLGVNAILRPRSALEDTFKFPAPTAPSDQKLVDNLMRIYGGRNIAMALASGIATYFGHTKALGWILIGMSVPATVDGFVSRDQIGSGQWSHWYFTAVSLCLGSALLGVFDRT